jgi:hypothetical protein
MYVQKLKVLVLAPLYLDVLDIKEPSLNIVYQSSRNKQTTIKKVQMTQGLTGVTRF